VFFWSEEEAVSYRKQNDQIEGTYLTLAQAAWETRIMQGALFAFFDGCAPETGL
jgi:hypothetical protein